MASVKVSSQIEAPVDRVFAVFTDVEHGAEHVSGIREIEMLTPGKFGPGTRWRETREVMGRLDEAEMEVTAFEANKTYTITHYKAGVRIDTVFSFEKSGSGTQVTVDFDLANQGLPPGLLTPLGWALGGKIKEVLGHDLSDLKSTAEKRG